MRNFVQRDGIQGRDGPNGQLFDKVYVGCFHAFYATFSELRTSCKQAKIAVLKSFAMLIAVIAINGLRPLWKIVDMMKCFDIMKL